MAASEAYMNHAYYLSDDLDELEVMHDELLETGITDQNIHVISDDEDNVEKHHMLNVSPFAKTNVIRTLFIGVSVGIATGVMFVSVPFIFGFAASPGSIPFTLAGVFILSFATFEGGFLGLQKAHPKYKSVWDRIHHGKHLMVVDYENEKAPLVKSLQTLHPKLETLKL